MTIISLFFTLFITFLLGAMVLFSLIKEPDKLHPLEKAALSFAIGLGFVAAIMLLFTFFNIPLSRVTLFPVIIAACFIIYLIKFRKTGLWRFFGGLRWAKALRIDPSKDALSIVLALYVALKAALVFFEALIKPVVDVDAISMYSFVAKAIFVDKVFNSTYLNVGVQDKPLFPYLTQAWIAMGINDFNDCLIKIIGPILFLSFALIIFSVLRRGGASRAFSLFFAALFVSMPFISYHASTAYADLTMTFYYAASTIYLWCFLKEFKNDKASSLDSLAISILLLCISLWVKRAGFFLFGINVFVLFLFLVFNRLSLKREDLNRLAVLACVSMVLFLPWLAYGRLASTIATFSNIKSEVVSGNESGSESLMDKTGVIASVTLNKLFYYSDWHLLWAAFLLALALGGKYFITGDNIYFLMLVFLNILAVFVHLRAGGSFNWLLDGTLFDRMVMPQTPVLLYFISQALMKYDLAPVPAAKPLEEKRKSGKTKKGR